MHNTRPQRTACSPAMHEFMATSERRAQLYGWFASLFAAPLTQAELDDYDTYDGRNFLKSLATLDPMRPAVDSLNQAMRDLFARPDARQALAENFLALFGALEADASGAKAALAPALALHYLEPADDAALAEHLQHWSLTLTSQAPLASLTLRLDAMSALILRAIEATDASGRQHCLCAQSQWLPRLDWVGAFSQRCRQHDQLGFYGAISELLRVFLLMDANYLTLAHANNAF
ncbi:MAG: molecular chaperone TorD [Aeromonas sp.]